MKRAFTLFLVLFIIGALANSQIRLPKLISNDMVLQRNSKVNIWGWASPQEQISIEFNNGSYSTQADNDGNWAITLDVGEAGGPYIMRINGKNSIQLNNILVGDVWLCSGQSNMELPIRRVEPMYREEIKTINNENIRLFNVPKKYNFNEPLSDTAGGQWLSATPEHIMEFSAVAYFFAKHIQEQKEVPIGLINSSLGGSPVEAWISENDLKPFSDAYREMQKFKDPELIDQIKATDQQRANQWFGELAEKDLAYQDDISWTSPNFDDSEWKYEIIPGYWNSNDLKGFNGAVWFRKTITVPERMENKAAKLELGTIVDADSVFVNGYFIGNTTYQYPPRWYNIPENILKEGDNNITIKVISESGTGGFVPDKRYELTSERDTIKLMGRWKYKIGACMYPLQSQTFIRWKPGGLYNGMIHPITPYTIKGAVWYQGESNTNLPSLYENRLKAMIDNWRRDWQQGDFPFLIVQLANYMAPTRLPLESQWAELRQAQYNVAKEVDNSALVVTIDLGEWNDIHPMNKDDVGKRLALAAEKVAYGNAKVVSSGPEVAHWKQKDSKVTLYFENTGKGLVTPDQQPVGGFAIAGSDGHFVWANAIIKGNKVEVWHDSITDPKTIRYAWADNPINANLYNKNGLPAVPFKITVGE